MNKTYTIDAEGKKLGRVASQAASYLMGKHSPSYKRNELSDVKVAIINCSKAAMDEKKKKDKIYVTFTGFRGGLFNETLGHLTERKGYSEAFRLAVYRMLPSNSHRKEMMKNLSLSE